jgi:hypothetical protein
MVFYSYVYSLFIGCFTMASIEALIAYFDVGLGLECFGEGLEGFGRFLSNFVVSTMCSTLSYFVVSTICSILSYFRCFYHVLDFELFRVFSLFGLWSLVSCVFATQLLEPSSLILTCLLNLSFFRVFSLFGFWSLVSCVFAIRLLEPLSLIFTMSFFGHFAVTSLIALLSYL